MKLKQNLGFVRTTWMASLAVVVGLCVSSVRADVTWVTQSSSSPVTFSGVQGQAQYNYINGSIVTDANGNTIYNDLYTALPQTDAGTSYNGFNNSMITTASGTLTTVGNTFLSSLNFGNKPANPPTYAQFTPTTSFGNNGNWLPNGPTGGPFPGTYGTATTAQAGFTLVGASGTNQLGQPYSPHPGGGPLDGGFGGGGGPNGNGSAGRVQFNGTAGIANSHGNATSVTNGTFDGGIIHFTGVLGVAINYQGDLDSSGHDHQVVGLGPASFFIVAGGLGDISNNFSGLAAQGTISRGAGANSYQYVMTVPYQADLALDTPNGDNNSAGPGHGTTTAFDYKFTTTFSAIANLAKGDVNFDGVVNGLDIAAVSSNWLQSNAQKLGTGDANGDGVVNGLDIAMISSNWLATTPPLGGGGGGGSAVPEPSTLVLLGLGTVGLLFMRRRVRHRQNR